jgi:hypothetical protein
VSEVGFDWWCVVRFDKLSVSLVEALNQRAEVASTGSASSKGDTLRLSKGAASSSFCSTLSERLTHSLEY